MKFFAIFAVFALLAIAKAQDLDMPNLDRAKTCVKVRTVSSFSESTAGCKPGQVRKSVTNAISIPPVSRTVRVTMKCFKPNRAARVQKRINKCIKVFMKRCRCVEAAWLPSCIDERIAECAPQADKTVL